MSKKGATKGKTAAAPTESKSYKIGDLVLYRIKGYPWWPAKVVDPEKEYLGKEVVKTKPSKKQVHLVKFYDDAAQYIWAGAKELNPLTAKAIETFIGDGSKKNSALMKAYKTAQDPESWEAEQQEAMEAARNRTGADDELDSEDEVESKPTDGKRKRKADSSAKDSGDKKKAKVDKKETKPKGKAAKKKAAPAEEDMSEGAVKCRDWRHKLQKAFLTKGLPNENDIVAFDAVFKEMESFEHQTKWLVPSKLPKVVKRIAAIKEPIPKDDEYKFKSRAAALVEQWKDSLIPEGEEGEEKKFDDAPAAAETNGTSGDASPEKETEPVEVVEDKKEVASEETADVPMEAESEAKVDEEKAA